MHEIENITLVGFLDYNDPEKKDRILFMDPIFKIKTGFCWLNFSKIANSTAYKIEPHPLDKIYHDKICYFQSKNHIAKLTEPYYIIQLGTKVVKGNTHKVLEDLFKSNTNIGNIVAADDDFHLARFMIRNSQNGFLFHYYIPHLSGTELTNMLTHIFTSSLLNDTNRDTFIDLLKTEKQLEKNDVFKAFENIDPEIDIPLLEEKLNEHQKIYLTQIKAILELTDIMPQRVTDPDVLFNKLNILIT